MSKPIDISVGLHSAVPAWPGSTGFRISQTQSIRAGDGVNVSRIDMDVHSGTHVESALHFIDGGAPLDALPLETFIGPARVVHLPDADRIGPHELERAGLIGNVERVLLRTRNSVLWSAGVTEFQQDYVALTVDGARWLAERRLRLVGIDYLSIQLFGGGAETHRVLMRSGVAILEGINLDGVPPGDYRLICLPLSLMGTEASPARAILEPMP